MPAQEFNHMKVVIVDKLSKLYKVHLSIFKLHFVTMYSNILCR